MSDLVIEKKFSAPPETVFDAWTDPELMAQWFFVGPNWSCQAQANPQEGGEYRVQMNTDTGETHSMFGVYKEFRRPDRLVFTWTSAVAEDTLVILEFNAIPEGTLMTLTHRLLPNQEIREEHRQGWEGCLGNLGRFIDGTA